MVAGFVLVAGVILILVAALLFFSVTAPKVLMCIVPLAPGLVMLGTFFLILTEFFLFFGNKDDRRAAKRDLAFLFPMLIVSGGVWYAAFKLLW